MPDKADNPPDEEEEPDDSGDDDIPSDSRQYAGTQLGTWWDQGHETRDGEQQESIIRRTALAFADAPLESTPGITVRLTLLICRGRRRSLAQQVTDSLLRTGIHRAEQSSTERDTKRKPGAMNTSNKHARTSQPSTS